MKTKKAEVTPVKEVKHPILVDQIKADNESIEVDYIFQPNDDPDIPALLIVFMDPKDRKRIESVDIMITNFDVRDFVDA